MRMVVAVGLLLACAALPGAALGEEMGDVASATLTVFLPGDVPLELVLIPAGHFRMGVDASGPWFYGSEGTQPVRTVTFSDPFYMGKYPVTQRQWEALSGENPSYFKNRPDAPVESVSWHACQSFLLALNNHVVATRQGPAMFRLPSEGEWEYAARAGTTTRFYFGDSTCEPSSCNSCELSDYAWWCGNNSGAGQDATYGTKPVGQKKPNAWGLHDMHGNVGEWCQDCLNPSYVGAPADGSAWEQGECELRVVRGGYWDSVPLQCQPAVRGAFYTFTLSKFKSGSKDIGLRVAASY